MSQIQNYQDDKAYTSLKSLLSLRHLARYIKHVPRSVNRTPLIGSHKSRTPGRGMEFEEVRQYQAGDDIRTIDWRVTARTQITHTKRYTEEKEKPVITAVDQRQSLFFGSHPCFKSVYACHITALLNWATLERGDRCGGIVLGNHSIEETRAARHHKTVNRWLQQLSYANESLTAHTKHSLSLNNLFERLLHTRQTGSSLYIISDFYDLDKHCESLIFQLSRHQQVNLIWVYDQLETDLPKNRQLTISDGSNSTSLFTESNLRQYYQQIFKHKEDTLNQISQKLQVPFIKAPVQTPAVDICRGILSS